MKAPTEKVHYLGTYLDALKSTFVSFFTQIWEKLILSKLNWDVNLVVPNDYLSPVLRQLQVDVVDVVVDADNDDKDVKNELLRDVEIVASLVHRSAQFTARHPPRLVASASILLAIRECQSRGSKSSSGEESLAHFSNVLSSNLRRGLSLTTPQDELDLKNCLEEMVALLWKDLPKSPPEKTKEDQVSSPVKFGTPPGAYSAGSSPFKISSASTPKRSRLPLRDGSNLPTFRRRLQPQVKYILYDFLLYLIAASIEVTKGWFTSYSLQIC